MEENYFSNPSSGFHLKKEIIKINVDVDGVPLVVQIFEGTYYSIGDAEAFPILKGGWNWQDRRNVSFQEYCLNVTKALINEGQVFMSLLPRNLFKTLIWLFFIGYLKVLTRLPNIFVDCGFLDSHCFEKQLFKQKKKKKNIINLNNHA